MQTAAPLVRSRKIRALTAIPCAAVVAALAFSAQAPAATVSPTSPVAAPTTVAPVSTSQGIIMRDGGVCDPIRHMGC